MGPGGRFEVEDGIREGVLDSCCQRRQLRVAGNSCLWGKCGLCLQRGVRLWDPQFPCVLALPWCKKPCWRRPPPFIRQMLVEPLLSASCGSRCGRRSRVDMVPALMRAKLRERQKRKSSLSETHSDRGACREEWDRPRDGQGGCLQGPVRDRAGAVGMVAAGQSRDRQATASTRGFILRTTGKPQRGLSRPAPS